MLSRSLLYDSPMSITKAYILIVIRKKSINILLQKNIYNDASSSLDISQRMFRFILYCGGNLHDGMAGV